MFCALKVHTNVTAPTLSATMKTIHNGTPFCQSGSRCKKLEIHKTLEEDELDCAGICVALSKI